MPQYLLLSETSIFRHRKGATFRQAKFSESCFWDQKFETFHNILKHADFWNSRRYTIYKL